MKISVIIPVYNVQNYLEECLASVAAQTFRDYEIIAVNDCTPDSSMEVLMACVEKYHILKGRIRVIKHEKNRGLSAARNTGIQNSNAEYVYFLDSDDTITPDCLEKLVGVTERSSKMLDMVVGNYVFDGPELGCPHIAVDREFLNGREYIKAYCKEQIYPMAWNRLVRREFIVRNNLFFEEGLIHEDTLWNFQVLQYVRMVGIVKDNIYIYRIRQNSIQSSDDFEKHFWANSYIVGRLSEIMFGSVLRYNKYVYNFVEQEKWRHLCDCRRSGNMHLVRELYNICRNKPYYNPLTALFLFGWNREMRRKIRQRDLHYLFSFKKGLKKFSCLPDVL